MNVGVNAQSSAGPLWRYRRTTVLFILVGVLLVPLFLCGLSGVLYLVFPPPHLDILVIGLDSRQGEGMFGRADSLMLIGIDPALLRVSVLSIPRDVFIDIPGYGLQRINTVNVLGEQQKPGAGPALLSTSIARSFGVQPDRYVRLDFATFVELIDAVGGVSVDVERVMVDNAYPTDDGGVTHIRFESGLQMMNGEQALRYVRTRHADDDYRRAERQQQVFSALAEKLKLPVNWLPAWRILSSSVDTDLTFWDLLTLAPPVLTNAGRFEQKVIDRDDIKATKEGYAVLDYERLVSWLQGRFD